MQKKKSKHLSTKDIIVNEFTEESAVEFREKFLREAEKGEDYPIIVYIDSYGGYVDALASMVGTMQSVPNPVITVALGKAMSCGAILLSFGTIRYVDRYAKIMIHEVSGGAIGNVHDMRNSAEETARVNEFWMGLLADNCGIKGGYRNLRRIIKGKDGKDLYLNPEEAVEFGIADVIGMPAINPVQVYELYTVPGKPTVGETRRKASRKKKVKTKTSTTKKREAAKAETVLFVNGDKKVL